MPSAPCPHCAHSPARLISAPYRHWFQCDSCLATGPVGHSPEEATALWNQRLLMDIWKSFAEGSGLAAGKK